MLTVQNSSFTPVQTQTPHQFNSSKSSPITPALVKRIASSVQGAVSSRVAPLTEQTALQTIKLAQVATADRIRLSTRRSNAEVPRLKQRQDDLKLIYSAVSDNRIQFVGFVGWGAGTLSRLSPRQGISEYDSVVFIKDGTTYVEQLGSSYLRSNLGLLRLQVAQDPKTAIKLTPTGAVYNRDRYWTRVDSGNDAGTLPQVSSSPFTGHSIGRTYSHESLHSLPDLEVDATPTASIHITTALPSLKEEFESIIAERRPALYAAITKNNRSEILAQLRTESQRHHTILNGALGPVPTVYTDLNAYGNPLWIAREISHDIEEVVGNTHGTSQLAKVSTHYLNEAVSGILSHFGATAFQPATTDIRSSYDLLVRGSGFTGAFDEYLTHVKADVARRDLKLDQGAIAFTEYEHHSNSLPFQTWVQEGQCTQLPITADGTLDLDEFENFLKKAKQQNAPYILATLSLQSNVTSVKTDVDAIQRIVQQFISEHPQYTDTLYLSFDLAAYAPHGELKLDQLTRKEGVPLVDAIAFSPYKLDGGQQGVGVAIIQSRLTGGNAPRVLGGGTVGNVYAATSSGTQYNPNDRFDFNNAGSPNVMGIVNTYLGLYFKELVGTEIIKQSESKYTLDVYRALNDYHTEDRKTRIRILGPTDLSVRGNTFPIIVETTINGKWRQLPPGLVGQAIEHFTGVVTRSGCNCAGPYAYKLFGLTDDGTASKMALHLKEGGTASMVRPGWTRATLSPLLTDAEVDYFKWAWRWFADNGTKILAHYQFNHATNGYDLVDDATPIPVRVDWKLDHKIHAGGRVITFPNLNTPDILVQRRRAVERYIDGYTIGQTTSVLGRQIDDAWTTWEAVKNS